LPKIDHEVANRACQKIDKYSGWRPTLRSHSVFRFPRKCGEHWRVGTGDLIDKLRHSHSLDRDEVVHVLKLSFISYKTNALQVTKKKVDVLQWH
jgi:hypothetical protein